MGLGRKNLVYSLALAGAMMMFLIGYFMYMLPSLYVDYTMEQNLQSVREQHNDYVRTGSYEGVAVKNSAACFSMEILMDEDRIFVTGKSFSAEIIVKEQRLQGILERCRKKIGVLSDSHFDIKGELEELSDVFTELMEKDFWPIEFRLLNRWEEEEFFNESVKVHFYSDHMYIIEAGIEDSENHYTNYIVFEQREGSIVFTLLPVVAPDMDEIRPVVLRSLPMLGAVILFMVLLFSRMYSRGIVIPVVKLVRRAEEMKSALDSMGKIGAYAKCAISGTGGKKEYLASEAAEHEQNEIKELGSTLEDFYQQIRKSLNMLEEKNRELEEENERQEIFLRASSHQLKTPIAAALLLADGMINEVGRYRDTKMYLPKVKEQLLSMKKIVEDILYLNHCTENIHPQPMDVEELLRERLRAYQIPIAEKDILVEWKKNGGLTIVADELILSQILDNLLSNGVKYTPAGGRIGISICQQEKRNEIRIENFGVTIPEDLLPHIFEPFVSGSHGPESVGSHGLGLYIASYYARKSGFSLLIYNGEDSVVALLGTNIL